VHRENVLHEGSFGGVGGAGGSAGVAFEQFAVLGVRVCEAFVEGSKADKSTLNAGEVKGVVSINIGNTVSNAAVIDDNVSGLACIFVEKAVFTATDKGTAGVKVEAFLRDDQDHLGEAIKTGFGSGDSGAKIGMFGHKSATADVVMDA